MHNARIDPSYYANELFANLNLDWDRDYGTASEDGMNIFRHWFCWNAVEIEPGVYDWSDYDRQLDLAAENAE